MDGYEMDGRELREDYARHERHHLVADEMVLKCSRKQNDKRLTGDQEVTKSMGKKKLTKSSRG